MKKALVPFVVCALLLENCTLMFIRGERKSELVPADFDGARIVLLVWGAVCRDSVRYYANSTQGTGVAKCRRYSSQGYFPYQLLRTYPASDLPAFTNDVRLEVMRLTGELPPTKTPVRNLTWMRLGTEKAYQDYRLSIKQNVLELRFREVEQVKHWSGLVSMLTLGVFPGYTNYFARMEMTYFDGTGERANLKSRSTAYGNDWNHLVFLLWGPAISSAYDSGIVAHHMRNLLGQAAARIRKTP